MRFSARETITNTLLASPDSLGILESFREFLEVELFDQILQRIQNPGELQSATLTRNNSTYQQDKRASNNFDGIDLTVSHSLTPDKSIFI